MPLVPPGKSFHPRLPQGKAFHTGICTLLVPPRVYWCARAESVPWGNKQGIPCGKQVYPWGKPSPRGTSKAYPRGKHSPAETSKGIPVGEQARYTRVEKLHPGKVFPCGNKPRYMVGDTLKGPLTTTISPLLRNLFSTTTHRELVWPRRIKFNCIANNITICIIKKKQWLTT